MQKISLRMQMLVGDTAMDKLGNSHVAVFGLGGVGSWCAEALARAGIGKLSLIDEDSVAETNINRQLCALYSTLGQSKAEVMRRRIIDISPDIEVNAIEGHYEVCDRERFFSDYDYVVDAIDLVSCKTDLIKSCYDRALPIVSALGTGNKLDATKLKIGDLADTSYCPLARVMRRELKRVGIIHHTVVYSTEKAIAAQQYEAPPQGRRSVPGSVVWVPASAGMLLCQHVITELIKEK